MYSYNISYYSFRTVITANGYIVYNEQDGSSIEYEIMVYCELEKI